MRSLLLASLFVSASATACPDFSGKYAACKESDGTISSTDMEITQSIESGVTVYSSTSTDAESGERTTDQVIANGSTVTETDENGITFSMASSCNGDSVVTEVSAMYQGQSLGTATMVTKKEGNALVSRTTGNFEGMPSEDVSVCE